MTRQATTDDLDALLAALPPEIVARLRELRQPRRPAGGGARPGRRPEARFTHGEEVLLDREIVEADIAHVIEHIGAFGGDNRAGIERTLHRISAIRNRAGKVVGLTCRIGRAVFGTIDIIRDIVEGGQSVVLLGRPGIGKTTMLREVARVLADDLGKRVIVVDTSNEIAGDGDIPHPGHRRRAADAGARPRRAARGDDRGGREPHARGDRHRRDRDRAGGGGGPHDRGARRAAGRHRARQHARQPDAEPDPLGPGRRHPDRHPRRRGGAPARDAEDGPGAQGAAHLRRGGRDRRARQRDRAPQHGRDGRRHPARPHGPARVALARGRRAAGRDEVRLQDRRVAERHPHLRRARPARRVRRLRARPRRGRRDGAAPAPRAWPRRARARDPRRAPRRRAVRAVGGV